MPKALEEKLKKEAIQRRLKGKDKNAFIYGTMRKTGWRPGDGNNHDQLRTKKTGSD
jgi:hypothetical protein